MLVPIAIVCKSYLPDIKRVVRLMESIARYNRDDLPVYLLVAREEKNAFADAIKPTTCPVNIIEEERVLDAARSTKGIDPYTLSGSLRQQLVKSEAWRLELAENLLVIDSDSFFIRDFFRSDFLHPSGTPYTAIHQAQDILGFAARSEKKSIITDYHRERDKARGIFKREGHNFDFGPTPIIWSAQVWKALHEHKTEPLSLGFADLLQQMPTELLWYGESMLAYTPIPLHPIDPLFKVFHYSEQFTESQQLGENESVLAENYLGIVVQSYWDESMDATPRKKRRIKHLWLKKS